MKKDSIGNRMKDNYEKRYKIKLTRRTPVIIRLDGKAFHTLTRKYKCEKPFDNDFQLIMEGTAIKLCKEIQGAQCAYVQSDEISLLLTDFNKLTTNAWFDYNLQKVVSVSAGIASTYFTINYCNIDKNDIAIFDSRVFNIPKEEVCNYFVWRQQDWVRNSIQMLSQSYYSHKELHKKNQANMHEMLYKKGVNWNDLDSKWKNGIFICKIEDYKKLHFLENLNKWSAIYNVIFSKNKEIIDRYLIGED